MRVWYKVKTAQLRILRLKLHKEAQKLALAVVITQYLIAGSWLIAEKQGLLDYFKPRIVVIEIARAETPKVEEVKTDRTAELMDLIWLRESTRGKNNYSKCEAQGKVNGIGYGIPGNGKYICFDSHEEEMQVLRKWIESRQAQGMADTELLCLYSGSNYKECKN